MSKQSHSIKSGSAPPYAGQYLRQSFSQQDPIIFGFKHLDVDRGKFSCGSGEGDSLLKMFKYLTYFCGYNQMQMGSLKNYHPYDDTVVRKNKFEDLVTKSPSGKLHQIGKKRTPERIIGFFEKAPNNLFQICILDLKHQACPEH